MSTHKKPILDIRGFIDMSLIDWDGKVCSVIFLPGCNFRCGFCHNSPIIVNPHLLLQFSFEGVLEYMTEHRDFIDGLVITGGEATLHPELPEAIKIVKEKGFLVKLDTNGSNPNMLEKLLKEKLIDFVAMDLKAPLIPALYLKTINIFSEVDLEGKPPETLTDKIKKSLSLLKSASIGYELRTTVVPTFIDEGEIFAMAQSLQGMKKWVLQQFVPRETLDKNLSDIKPYSEAKMREFVEIGKRYLPTIGRGF